MPDLRLELLFTESCGNAEPAAALLESVRDALAPGAAVHRILVRDPAHAAELAFPGSPTLRVNGEDVEGPTALPAGFT